jgi:hypothetical protein
MIYLILYLLIGLLYCFGALAYSYFFEEEASTTVEKSIGNFIFGLIVGALVWPFLAYIHLDSYFNPPFKPDIFAIKEQDLIEAMSILEVEEKEIIHDPLNAVLQVPFGHLNDKWEEFTANNTLSTLWSFKSEYKDYSGIAIKEGYAKLEDDGSIKAFFINHDYRKPTK